MDRSTLRSALRTSSASTLRDGLMAGAIATGLMSGVMLARQAAGKMGRMPPKVITGAALDAAGGEELPESTVDVISVVTHFAFGASAGGVFALLRKRLPVSRGIAGGIAYGTLVWLVNYAGWVPALGIMPPPSKDRPGRPTSMLFSHWIYGGALSALLQRRDR